MFEAASDPDPYGPARSTDLNYLLLVGLALFSSAFGAVLVALCHMARKGSSNRLASQPKKESPE